MVTLTQRKKWARIIKAKRKATGLSQEAVAMLNGKYGLSYFQKIENAMDGSEDSFKHFAAFLDSYQAEKTA